MTATRSRSSTARCRAPPRRGQERPTPLILRYGRGLNALHQDLYGTPSSVPVLTVLSESGVDYEGGEFVLMEQASAQSQRTSYSRHAARSSSFPPTAPAGRPRLLQGRPPPRRGTVTRGSRTALGIIFHDAR
jgi:hypothetical protein